MTGHTARASMLIRRPVAEVFDAFVNPGTITKFWLDRTTGPLAPRTHATWHFMLPGATETVTVTGFEAQERIDFEWSGGLRVSMQLTAHRENGFHLPACVVQHADRDLRWPARPGGLQPGDRRSPTLR